MRRLALVAAMLLAGCTASAPQPEQQPTASASDSRAEQPEPAEPQAASHEEIFGQWRLVDMPGRPPDYPHEIHLLIGRYMIEAVSQCIPFGKMLPGAVAGPARPNGDGSLLICARMMSPTEQSFGRTLAAADTIEKLLDGRLQLRGRAGTLVLARNAEPVLNPFQNTPGPGPHLMWGEWRVAAINGKRPSSPMTMLFFKERLEVGSGCVHFGRRIEQEGATLRLSPDSTITTVCERMTSADESLAGRILSGTVSIARSTPRQRLLSGKSGSILLVR